MRYKIRGFSDDVKLTAQAFLEVRSSGLPPHEITAVVETLGLARVRHRKLRAAMGIMLAIAMCLWARQSLSRVLDTLLQGSRFMFPGDPPVVASQGAISQLRDEIGAKPLALLCHRLCRPMATPDPVGAYRGAYRLMGRDGTIEDLADTPENGAVLGRHRSGRGEAAFPQVQSVYLCELGPQAMVDCGFDPVQTSEHNGANRLTRSIEEEMLGMWDAGLHSYASQGVS